MMAAHNTKNFKVAEFSCKCGHFNCPHYAIQQELVDALQALRDIAGYPIHVNSGYRCPSHNKEVGGERNSKHLLGIAADIRCDELSPKELKAIAEMVPEFRNGGIGVYDWGIHVDVRGHRARWDYRGRRGK